MSNTAVAHRQSIRISDPRLSTYRDRRSMKASLGEMPLVFSECTRAAGGCGRCFEHGWACRLPSRCQCGALLSEIQRLGVAVSNRRK